MEWAYIKFFAFWTFNILFIPLSIYLCQVNRKAVYWVFSLLIFTTCIEGWTDINFLSDENYRSATRGFEIHLADICALILLLHIFLNRVNYKIDWFPPLTIPVILLLIMGVISWIGTETTIENTFIDFKREKSLTSLVTTFTTWLYPLFEIHKIIRGYLIYWISLNLFQDKQYVKYMIRMFVGIAIFYTVMALKTRYIDGVNRVTLLSHINIFNSYIGMIGAFLVPFVFATKNTSRKFFYWFAVMGSLLCIVLSISRSSLMGFVIIMAIGGLIAYGKYFTNKNTITIFVTCALGLMIFMKSYDTLVERFFASENFKVNMAEREMYNKSAVMMADDHLFGVGLGNFSAYSVIKYGELASADSPYKFSNRKGTLAHNIWFLTLAEIGYIGLIIFIFYWLRFYQMLFATLISKKIRKSDLLFSCLIGILCVSVLLNIQNLFHFSYRHTSIYFIFSVITGLLGRLYIDRKKQSQEEWVL